MLIKEIVSKIVEVIIPILPYLEKGSEAAASEAGKKFGQKTWETASSIWQKLTLKLKQDESVQAQKYLNRYKEKPEDERLRAAFELELEDLLGKDSKLKEELIKLLNENNNPTNQQPIINATSHGDGSVALGQMPNTSGGEFQIGGSRTVQEKK